MSDDVSRPETSLAVVRPTVLPSLAQFGIERDLAIRLAHARGFLPDHYLTGDGTERAAKVLAAIEYARALTQAARGGAQDAVLGMAYTADELGVEVDYDGNVDVVRLGGGIADPLDGKVLEGEVVTAPGLPEATAGTQLPTASAIQPT